MAATVDIPIELRLERAVKELTKFSKQANKSVTGVQKSFDNLGKAAVAAVGAFAGFKAVSGFISAAVGGVADLSKSVAEVQSIAGDLGKTNEELTQQFIDLSNQFGTDATDQAATFYQILSAGVTDAAAATETLDAANKLAIGGLADVGASVDILTTAMNVYGQDTLGATEASDALFTAVKLGKTTVDELASSLGNVLPNAKAVGVSFEETTGTVAALTAAGISTSEAVTGLNAVFAGVIRGQKVAAKQSKEVQKAFSLQALQTKGLAGFLKDLEGATGGSSEKLLELFGSVEALKTVNALAGDEFVRLTQTIEGLEDSAGAASTAFDTITNTVGFQLDLLRQRAGNIVLQFGAQGQDFLLNALKSLNTLLIENQDSIKQFAKDVVDLAIQAFPIAVKGAELLVDGFVLVTQAVTTVGQNIVKAVSSITAVGAAIGIFSDETAANMADFEDSVDKAAVSAVGLTDKISDGFESITAASGEAANAAAENSKKIVDASSGDEAAAEKQIELEKQKAAEAQKTAQARVEAEQKARDEALKAFDAVRGQIENVGLSEIEVINKTRDERLKAIDEAFKTGAITAQQLADNTTLVELDALDKVTAANKAANDKKIADNKRVTDQLNKDAEDFAKKLRDTQASFAAQPLQFTSEPLIKPTVEAAETLGITQALTTGLSQGAEGAKNLLVGGASAALDTIIPGLGQAVAPLLDALTGGPDAAREFVQGFIGSIPDLISNIAFAIPALIDEFANQIPIVALRLADEADNIAIGLIKGLIKASPKLALALARDVPIALVEGISKELTGVELEFDNEKFNNILDDIGTKISETFGLVFENAGIQITESITSAFEPIATVFTGIADRLSASRFTERIENAAQIFTSGIRNAVSFLRNGFTTIVNAIREPLVGPFQQFGNIVRQAVEFHNQTIKRSVEFFRNIVRRAGEIFTTAIRSVVDFFQDNIIEPIQKLGDKLSGGFLGGGGGGGGDIVSSAAKAIGLQSGGEIPTGFNENFPARLSSGETVVPRGVTDDLRAFLGNQGNQDNSIGLALLTQILDAVSQPVVAESTAEVNGEALANIILTLNRQNQRLA